MCNGGVRQNPSAQTEGSCRTVSRIYSGTGSGRQRADSKSPTDGQGIIGGSAGEETPRLLQRFE